MHTQTCREDTRTTTRLLIKPFPDSSHSSSSSEFSPHPGWSLPPPPPLQNHLLLDRCCGGCSATPVTLGTNKGWISISLREMDHSTDVINNASHFDLCCDMFQLILHIKMQVKDFTTVLKVRKMYNYCISWVWMCVYWEFMPPTGWQQNQVKTGCWRYWIPPPLATKKPSR